MEWQHDGDRLAEFGLGRWRVQPSLNRLVRGAETVRLEPKLMDVLLLLARQAGAVVSKEEIVEVVWPSVFISESVITRAIAGLRRALGDDARSPSYIETITKRGYRLLVQPAPASLPAEPGKTPNPVARAPSAGAPPREPPELKPPRPAASAAAPAGEAAGGPFVVGQWVRGARFFGREAEIREVLYGPRNGLWLLGARAVGKTSLLKHLELLTEDGGDRGEEGGYFPLFWDLQGSSEPEDLHRDFAAALAEAEGRLERSGLALEEVADEDFFVSIGRLRRALRSRGRTLLLLWDEVDELLHLQQRWPALLRKLRRALQSQEGIRTVLASGPRLWQLGEQRDATSPFLHGFAPPLYLGPLDPAAAAALVSQGKAGERFSLEAGTVSELQRRSGNHPALLQLLARHLLETGDLEAATEAAGADLTVRYFLSVDFDLLTSLGREVLLALAAQDTPISARDLDLSGPPGEVESCLLHLERLGQVCRREGGRLDVAGTIRRRWLRQQRPA